MTKSKKEESPRTRRAFGPEFKVEAVRLMRERRALGVSVAQIGRDLGVRPDMLRRWAREVEGRSGKTGRDGVRGIGPEAEAELRRLQRENTVLRQERDFLKKAAAFFAKESR